MENLKQNLIIDLTQFGTTCWAKHNTFQQRFEGRKNLEEKDRHEVKQMQPMWLCILSGRQFEDTFENAQRRKVEQMQ